MRAVQELQVLKVSCTPLAPRGCQCYMLGPVLRLDTLCREHTQRGSQALCMSPQHSNPSHTSKKTFVYSPIKAELSFKNQLISLVRGCEAELQRQGRPCSSGSGAVAP